MRGCRFWLGVSLCSLICFAAFDGSAQSMGSVCAFQVGPRAGQFENYFPQSLPIGHPCTDRLGSDGLVVAMPPPPSQLPLPPGKTLSLGTPVQGLWRIVQGPPCPGPGNHCRVPSNQMALDFVPLDNFGNCMGMPLQAPISGTIIEAVDGFPDVQIDAQPAGNHIVIDDRNGAFVIMAHFQMGSVAVRVGDVVSPGQVVGKCGRSGNGTGPHLHMHAQDSPVVTNWYANPIQIIFDQARVMSGGACQQVSNHAPRMGDVLC